MNRSSGALDAKAACRWLGKHDAVMKTLIARVGPCGLPVQNRMTVFQYLVRSIVYQQLSGRAAGTIHSRVCGLFPNGRPTPDALLALSSDELRAAGLSQSKQKSVRDLALRAASGQIPDRRSLRWMDDEDIIRLLTEVRGVGRWTVEMLLIFDLGRPDVLPVGDLGVQKGFRHAYGWKSLPAPDELKEFGERWQPYRSVAAWYLWRCLD
jgi:3-methyladenine DNA glycosylase/8-oxoguanine DNA glycosylase